MLEHLLLTERRPTKQFSFVFTSLMISDVTPSQVEYFPIFPFSLPSNYRDEDRVCFFSLKPRWIY